MPSWQIVYEWEDDFIEAMNLKMVNAFKKIFFDNKLSRYFIKKKYVNRLIRNVDLITQRETKAIAFDLFPRPTFSYITSCNVIPIIIDFWLTEDLDAFYENYQNCKFVCISSLEAYNYLKKKKCPLEIYHLPLSISDRYNNSDNFMSNKRFDLILAGRENLVLQSFLDIYKEQHPELNIVYRQIEDGKINFYSTKDGFLGNFNSRSDYFKLLTQCKIGFYSTPGIDGGEVRTGGANPVTPRFLELLSAGCRVVSRYQKNDDTEFYELENMTVNALTYEVFSETMDVYLNELEFPKHKYETYLSKHYTSERVCQLQKIIIENENTHRNN
ncbi:glycosyltransferase family 1 protein [Pedobacter endophyticus]|uniref:Glycosyltransferase family 1 protein n=1 Tax=Pedobacter endophyticus TaxID=2789740 RepID=A0A7U3Q4A9_9SPHI|nr:glycosyltransferase family 1 protein [Pedobacter endophyticus]QPH38355.1 glycosyltransferase family 1 protein [Pedobacter endophyticus]